MNNKKFLREKKYQKTSKKLGLIGLPILIIGILGFFGSMILTEVLPLKVCSLISFLSIPCIGIGAFMFMLSKRRSMLSYTVQAQMPVAQEGIEKMAPYSGVVAKEIAKGVKKGLKEEDEE